MLRKSRIVCFTPEWRPTSDQLANTWHVGQQGREEGLGRGGGDLVKLGKLKLAESEMSAS